MIDFKDKKILIVEDSRVFLNWLKYVFENQACKVLCLEQPPESLKELYLFNPDVIITDYEMPFMNGPEFCKILKEDERLQQVPIMMLTGKQGDESMQKSITEGADDFMRKENNEELVLIKIHALLRLKAMKDEFVKTKQSEALQGTIATINHEINNQMQIMLHHMRKLEKRLEAMDVGHLEELEAVHVSYNSIKNTIKKLSQIEDYEEESYADSESMLKIK